MEIWNADRAGRLDNEQRRRSLPPDETLKKLGLKNGMNMADIGCGIGFFSIPAAHIVGDDFKVYAIDASADMINILLEKLEKEEIKNVVVIHTEGYDFLAKDESVDYALCCNVLHEVEDKERFAKEANRILTQKGVFAIIEWKKIQTENGPGIEQRMTYDEIKALLEAIGFAAFQNVDINESLYGLIATKM